MKFLLILFGIVLLTACGGKKERVLDMDDINPKASNEDEGKKGQKENHIDYGFDIWLAEKAGITVMEIDTLGEPMFVDRFQPKSFKKLNLQLKEGVVFLGQWTFKDSLRTMNAFFNWLDCFGPNCKAHKYLVEEKYQSDAMLIFLNDTSFTYISSSLPLDEKKWQKCLALNYGNDFWDLVLVQKKQRKALWYEYKIEPIKKEDTLFIKRKATL
ncbi:MAG: hypothetical protein ACK49D_08420 [Flavobacteriia bacterium]|jgi:hypothetical protein